ncbi:MAG TPA: hypothetical protein VK932_16320, partial [Kofleriaceae bacterium]|nr:hypothetical protein [Kofleriaceae bacterium]
MRTISLLALALALAASAALAACGPSGKQVATAQQARYQGDQPQIFAVMKQTVASKYKIEQADEAAMGVQTEARWYNPEGQAVASPLGDASSVPDGSLGIALVVELLPDGDRHLVSVKPLILRFHKGRPNPDVLDATDPSLPGWVHSKGDSLQVALHEALKPYEVGPAA